MVPRVGEVSAPPRFTCFLCLLLDVSGLLSCVAAFAHLIGDTIVQASATSHMVPMEPADRE